MIRTKDPVPTDYTGAPGAYVTAENVRAWCGPRAMVHVGKLAYPPGNIALRLPKDIIGIDVDAHSGKAGGTVLKEAEKRWGKLPPTWKSTARPASPLSGIRLYRVPEGLAWPGGLNKIAQELGFERTGGIELIRWDHRYVVCAPSLNPDADGAPYFWVTPDGETVKLPWTLEELEEAKAAGGLDFELPCPDDAADMPDGWVAGLTEGRQWSSSGSVGDDGEVDDDTLRAWIAARDDRAVGGAYPKGVCPGMERTIAKHILAVRRAGDEGGAHDAARDGAWAAIGDAAEGHYGIGTALVRLKNAFIEAVRMRRGGAQTGDRRAKAEWKRIVKRGITKVINEYTSVGEDGERVETYDDEDACTAMATAGAKADAGPAGDGEARDGGADGSSVARTVGRKPAGSSAYDFVRDDIGNAQRLKQRLGDDAVWCSALGGWHIWDERAGLWRVDPEAIRMVAEMMDCVRDMDAEAQFIEDLKQRAAFIKFIRSSGSMGRLRSALDGLKSLKDVDVAGEKFDSARNLLHCTNGVLELTADPANAVTLRPARREDYITKTTGIKYDPRAESEYWNKFLDRFLPDEEDRAWAQKLAGYSLLGGNPNRILVLCKGKTSTGKTTFAEAIRVALGGYGGPLPLSVLRDHQDERPRPDLLAVMDRRLVAADETSSAWELHADMIKRLTGSGVTSARGVFAKQYVEKVPLFTPWIATNNMPTIKAADPATRRRLLLIPFLHTVAKAEEDARYKEALATPEARAAVFAWAVAGWDLYLADDTLTDIPPHAVKAAIEANEQLSELDEFLTEACDQNSEHSITGRDLYQAYKEWCAYNGVEGRDVYSSTKFGKVIGDMGFDVHVLRVDGKNTRVRVGLKLNNAWERLSGKVQE
jgi:P4 family phage/plasmid primase-like protien